MNRTPVLLLAACLVLLPAVWISAVEHGDARMPNPFYAMDTAFARPGLSTEQQLDMVAKLGYAGIAWTETAPDKALAVAQQAEKRGLKMFTIYCGATVTPRGELTCSSQIVPMMKALKGHGTILWLHIGGGGPAFDSLTGGEPLVKKLRSLAEEAAANDLRIAIYPHVGEWTARFGDATKLARLVDRPRFGVCFNLCHALAMGDESRIVPLLEAARPVLFTVTINGADRGVGKPDWSRLIRTLDRGTFDVGIVLRKLREIGFTGPIGFQGYAIPCDSRSVLTPTIQAWRKLSAAGPSAAAEK